MRKVIVAASFAFLGLFPIITSAQTWQAVNTGLPADRRMSTIGSGGAVGLFIGGSSTNLANSVFMFKSTDNGGSWTQIGNMVSSINGYPVAKNFSFFGSTILVGVDGSEGIYLSTDGGASWSGRRALGTAHNYRGMTKNGSTIFAPSPLTGPARSTDDGLTWVNLQNGFPTPGFGIYVDYCVQAHKGKVFAGTGINGVYETSNDGDLWTASASGLGQVLDVIEFDNKIFAAGGASGVSYSANAGTNWLAMAPAVPQIRLFTTDGTNLFALANSGTQIYRTLGNQLVWFPVVNPPTNLAEIEVHGGYLFGAGNPGVYRVPLADILAAPVVPYVLVNTNNFTVNAGQSVSWTSTVYSNSPVTFQWQRAIGAGAYADIPGANSPNYSLVTATNDNNANFRLIATSTAGSVTNFAGNITVYSSGPGGRDTAFSPLVTFTRGFNPQVFAIAVQPDGKVLAAGNFSGVSANGSNYVRSGIARLNADGTLDTAFATGTGAGSFNGIFSVGMQPDGKVIVAGDFNSFDGVTRRGIARLHTNGLLDTNFPSFASSTSVSNIVVQPDGKILVGGNFVGLVRLTSNGTNDPTFSYGGSGVINNMANVIALQPDGKIIIGGSSTATAKRLARLNADGSFDSTFEVGTGPNGQVLTLALQTDGKTIFAGQFTAFNGMTNRFLLGRANADGSIDSSYNTSVGPNFPPASIAVHPNGKVYMGGSFTTMQGTNRPYLARMQDATVDMTFQADASVGAVNSVGLTLAGDVLVATGPRVMRLFADKVALNVARPFDQTINTGQTLTLTAFAEGTSAISYQWLKNGTNLAGATGATLTILNAQIADSGYYSVRVSNASGSKTSEAALVSVLGAPFIVTQPTNQMTVEFGSVTFSLLGVGSAPLFYQWQVNGTNILNATNFSLSLSNLQFSNAGNYTVTLSNAVGTLTSAAATLTVLPGAGALDPASLLGTGPANFNYVQAVARQSTDKLVMGGGFTLFSGLSRRYIVRLNADGSVDTNFVSAPEIPQLIPSGGLAVLPDDKILVRSGNTVLRLHTNGVADNTFSNVAFTTFGSAGVLGPVALADGKFLLAGGISTINGQDFQTLGKLVRFNANGTLDAVLNNNITFGGNALALAARDDGKIFLGGVISQVNGLGRTNFAVFNADGSLDTTFIRGSSFNSYIYDFAFQPDQKVLVAGIYTNYAGTVRHYITRLNADGSLDTGFRPVTDPNPGSGVFKIAVQDDGKIVMAGSFVTVNRESRNYLARLNADGSLDPDFRTGTGPNSANFFALALQFNGRVTVAGNFGFWNGVAKNGLVQLRGTPVNLAITRPPLTQYADAGSSLTLSVGVYTTSSETYQWRKNGTNIPGATSATLALSSLQTTDSGAYSVVVSNASTNMTSTAGVLTVLTVPLVLSQEGSATVSVGATNTLKATVVGAGAIGYQWQRNGVNISGATNVTLTLANTSLADAGIYVLVATNAYGAAESQPLALSVTYQPGRPDPTFAFGTGFNQAVNAMATQPDGKLLVSGYFTSYNGTTVPYFVRLNTDGTLDGSFNVTSAAPINFGSAGPIQYIALAPDGQIYVAGTFTNIAGVARTNLARFDTNGVFDPGFVPPATAVGSIYNLGVQSGGKLIIVGNFTTISGSPRAYIARLNANGSLDTGWVPATLNSIAVALAVQPDDKLVIGGSFTSVGGVSSNWRIARLNADGTRDTNYVNVNLLQDVSRIVLQPDGKILAAGAFSAAGGFNHQFFNRFLTNGAIDPPFSTNGIGANQIVADIAPAAGGKVLIRGSFTSVNGIARPGLARINNDGSVDTAYDPGAGAIYNNSPNNTVLSAMVALSDGRVALGGQTTFTNFSGTTVGKFVVLGNDGTNPLVVTAQSQSDTVSPGTAVNFAVAATGIGPLTYQWYAGAAGSTANPVAGATNNTLGVVVGTSVFNYWVRVTNGAGQTADSLNVTIGPETLLFTRQTGGIQFNWSGGYLLQMNTNLSLPNWTDVPGASPLTVPFDSATNRLFFRLRQEP
ncbi:MAG: immunoglobulin domain-containing protein [Verrucomicrobia bacterium]|nr:immunoglobulin domain-containing protein [Verrucomicrobiota bacterium]